MSLKRISIERRPQLREGSSIDELGFADFRYYYNSREESNSIELLTGGKYINFPIDNSSHKMSREKFLSDVDDYLFKEEMYLDEATISVDCRLKDTGYSLSGFIHKIMDLDAPPSTSPACER